MFRMRSALLALLLLPTFASAEVIVVQMTTVGGEPRFVPEEVDIRLGDTVRWINTDLHLEHSLSSGTGSADPMSGVRWSSGMLRLGEFFEHTFSEAGDFEYYSVPHEYEGMFGVVHANSTTDVPGGLDIGTWGSIKQRFAGFLPRQ